MMYYEFMKTGCLWLKTKQSYGLREEESMCKIYIVNDRSLSVDTVVNSI